MSVKYSHIGDQKPLSCGQLWTYLLITVPKSLQGEREMEDITALSLFYFFICGMSDLHLSPSSYDFTVHHLLRTGNSSLPCNLPIKI